MIRRLCQVSQLPGEGLLKAFIDPNAASPLALCVGVLDGVPYAIENACPHQRAPLSAGYLDGGEVVCPLHAWRWRLRDGTPVHPGDPAVTAYEVRRYGDEVFVRILEGGRSNGAAVCEKSGKPAGEDCEGAERSGIR